MHEDTLKDYLPPPKSTKLEDEIDYDNSPAIVPTTVIIALEDINLIFKLTPNQENEDG